MKKPFASTWPRTWREIVEGMKWAVNPVGYSDAVRVRDLERERDRYCAALEEIARQDYRGPRPHEQVIAERALLGLPRSTA